MIGLDELTIWEKLSGPYGNSEEIPPLIFKLSKTFDKEIADKILWEYIYHQGSIYENTLVTIPYLLAIIEKLDDINLKLDLILSLGIILIGFDETSSLENIFEEKNLNEKDQNRIRAAFIDSIGKFKKLINGSLDDAKLLEEETERFFLIAYLVSIKRHKEADIFSMFSGNDEYIFVCPSCEEETFLWNEENSLNAYSKDPVFNKGEKKLKIDLNEKNIDLEWLVRLIDNIEISSLKPLMPYFKGDINCHHCNSRSNVLEGIMNSI